MLTLEVKARSAKENLVTLRKSGFMPAVYYGKKQESTPVAIPLSAFLKVFRQAGESTVVTLKGPDGSIDTLIHEVDFDPVLGTPRHADFYVFEKGKKLEVAVPIEFIGVAPGVKDLGGLLVKVLHEIKIESLPQDLPQQLEVDISGLVEIGNQILASEIILPKGVTLIENPEEVVALISAPKEEKEEEALPIDLSAIEVEKKGKEKDGEEPAAEDAAAE